MVYVVKVGFFFGMILKTYKANLYTRKYDINIIIIFECTKSSYMTGLVFCFGSKWLKLHSKMAHSFGLSTIPQIIYFTLSMKIWVCINFPDTPPLLLITLIDIKFQTHLPWYRNTVMRKLCPVQHDNIRPSVIQGPVFATFHSQERHCTQ